MIFDFEKVDGKWYAVLPDYPGDYEDLEMVDGADTMLDTITTDDMMATLDVSDEEPTEGDYGVANLIYHDDMGGTYKIDCSFYTGEFWLCNVTHYVFGEHPETLYLSLKD